MKGRIEEDKKVEQSVLKRLEDQPEIIVNYYYWLPPSNTIKSKRVYINSIIKYSLYLQGRGKNITDTEFLSKIDRTEINRYCDSLKYKKNGEPNSISNCLLNLNVLKNFFDFLIDQHIMTTNPMYKYPMPKDNEEHEIVSMTEDEIEQVRMSIEDNSKMPERDLAIFTIGIRTGLRVSSIREINIQDIDWENMSIAVTEKGNKIRRVYFSDSTKWILEDWINYRNAVFKDVKSDALFLSRNHNRISYRAINNMLSTHTSMLDKHITPHKMRSTCATNLYDKTEDIYITAAVLGHSNLKNTQRYAKIVEKNRRKAAEILDEL